MSKNVADQMVEMLAEAGVKRIYAVTGDSLNYFNDAVRRSGKIKWIHVRNEEAGAFAAAAEAELEGIACCAGSCGPGHIHLINGLYDANRSHVPVIAIASTVDTCEFGMDYFQETNIIKLFDDCSVYNQLATTAAQVPRILQTAIQHAIYKKGVAVFGLPGDVSKLPAEEPETSLQVFHCKPLMRPSDAELQQLATAIGSHKKITIYCGIGAAEAHDEVIALAQKLKATVGYSFRAKMSIQYNNPYEVGMTGLLGLPSAFHSMHDSDLVLLLGTDFPYEKFMPVKNTIIQIDESPERLGRRAKLAMGLCGDIKDTITALLPLLQEQEDDSFLLEQLKFYEKVKEQQQKYVDDKGEENKIQPEFITACLDKLSAHDTIYTVDTGMCCVWGARFIHGTGERKMLGSFNHGSMANAMPMAIGASLAYPGRQVIALCGDGGLSMLLGDLATIKQYNLPIKIVVYNNRALGMVKLEMEVDGLPDNETDMINPDFAVVAQAMGFKGITITQPDEAEAAIAAALAEDGPVLLNIFTNPAALAMPPKVEWKQVKGMATSMAKLMLGGKMDEVLDTIKSNYKHIGEVV